MDLKTTYLGLKLRSPLMVSACGPVAESIDNIRRAEDAGASALVMYSLFEEQLRADTHELNERLNQGTESFAESLSYFPEPSEFRLGPEEYLAHIQKAKASVKMPIIGSLNGTSLGGWIDYAKKIEQAGADALELNIYWIPADMDLPGTAVEQTYIDILKAVKSAVKIPVAVKLSARFSSIANMAKKLDDAGANGLVLFNRFYQPDIDLESLEVKPKVLLSTPHAMRLPLRWIAILYKRIKADLAATSGIHTGEDAIKMLMAGANVTMLCSVLLKDGINAITSIEAEMVKWMEEHEYESVEQMRGSMSQAHCADPTAFERAQYMKALTGYRVPVL
jgi:dihydroorotate dehydrogenase (fumarate)